MDIHKDYAEFHITDYKVVSKEILCKKYDSKISDLRWIKSQGYKAGGGPTTGTLIMADGAEFQITYNWLGRNIRESPHDVETYTISIKGAGHKDINAYMKKYIEDIIAYEGKKATGILFNYTKEIEPWRCLESRWGLFCRGIKNDILCLLSQYQIRLRCFWKDFIPDEDLIRSKRLRSYMGNILFRKRKNKI